MADKGKENMVDDEIGNRVLELYMEMEAMNLALRSVIDQLKANPKHASKAQDFQAAIEQMMRSQEEVKNEITSWLNIDPEIEKTAELNVESEKPIGEAVTNFSAGAALMLWRMDDVDSAGRNLMDVIKKSGKTAKGMRELKVAMEAMKKEQEEIKKWVVALNNLVKARAIRNTSTEESTSSSPYPVASTSRNQPSPVELEEDDQQSEA